MRGSFRKFPKKNKQQYVSDWTIASCKDLEDRRVELWTGR